MESRRWERLDETYAAIESIGALCGVPDAGRALAARVRGEVEAASAAVRGQKPTRALFCLQTDPVIAAGRDTLPADLLERAGGINVVEVPRYPQLGLEAVIAAAPEVILQTAMDTRETDPAAGPSAFWSRWPAIPAVAAGRVSRVRWNPCPPAGSPGGGGRGAPGRVPPSPPVSRRLPLAAVMGGGRGSFCFAPWSRGLGNPAAGFAELVPRFAARSKVPLGRSSWTCAFLGACSVRWWAPAWLPRGWRSRQCFATRWPTRSCWAFRGARSWAACSGRRRGSPIPWRQAWERRSPPLRAPWARSRCCSASTRAGGRTRSVTLLLVGVVLNAFFSAVVLFLLTAGDTTRTRDLFFLLVGTIPSHPWSVLAIVATLVLAAVTALTAGAHRLNLLSLGDETAAHLGVRVERATWATIAVASLATAAAVAFAGIIGFVGLIVPHGLRLAFGPDHRLLVPGAALEVPPSSSWQTPGQGRFSSPCSFPWEF